MHVPVDYGITPGSGPGHLGLFGYDPLEVEIGRGILEAIGLGLEVRTTDIAVRGNFATVKYVEGKPIIIDRRAGRISTEENKRLISKIKRNIGKIEDVEVIIAPGIEHRFALILRFPDPIPPGSDRVRDTDPQKTGAEPLLAHGENPQAERVARIINEFVKRAAGILKNEDRANYVLLRGFFFLHVKTTDSFGEDGNWKGKIKVIEEFDGYLPDLLSLQPDVLAITGDHSTPSVLKGHSWHPVPLLISSPYVLGRTSERFTERECLKGEIGIIPAKKIMNLLFANARLLPKFGA